MVHVEWHSLCMGTAISWKPISVHLVQWIQYNAERTIATCTLYMYLASSLVSTPQLFLYILQHVWKRALQVGTGNDAHVPIAIQHSRISFKSGTACAAILTLPDVHLYSNVRPPIPILSTKPSLYATKSLVTYKIYKQSYTKVPHGWVSSCNITTRIHRICAVPQAQNACMEDNDPRATLEAIDPLIKSSLWAQVLHRLYKTL